MIQFELTENHIKLLRNMYFEYNEYSETGAPCADTKRPYGNSMVVHDVYEILYGKPWWDGVNEDDMPDDLEDELMSIHYGTGYALQIILVTKSFEPGMYEMEDERDQFSWRKLE